MKYYSMIINNGLSAYVMAHKHKDSRYAFFSFPAAAYKVEMVARDCNDGPIKKAVRLLQAYYKSDKYLSSDDYRANNKSLAARIADDLGLKQRLIEVILEGIKAEQSNPADAGVAGESAQRSGELKKENIYIIYDILSGKFLPEFIEENEFCNLRREVDDPYRYKPALADSKEWDVNVLRESGQSAVPQTPSEKELDIFRRNKKLRDISLQCRDFPERVNIVSACYYTKNDRYSYRIADPFRQDESVFLKKIVGLWMERGDEAGNKMRTIIEKIKPEIRADEAYGSVTKDGLREQLSKIANTDEMVKRRLLELILSYAYLYRLSNSSESLADDFIHRCERDIARQNYFISLYSFVEELFAWCYNKELKIENASACEEAVEGLTEANSAERLAALANELHFSMKGNSYLHTFTRDDIRANKITANTRLSATIYRNLIEAKFDVDHPFNKISKKYEDFLDFAIRLRPYRNKAKHGMLSSLSNNYRDCYYMMIDVFNMISGNTAELPDPQKIEVGELQDNFRKAYVDCLNKIRSYRNLWSGERTYRRLNDLGEQVMYESIAFWNRDAEYYAKLLNLYDEVLSQLIGIFCPFKRYVNEQMVKKVLDGKTENSVFSGALCILRDREVFPGDQTFSEMRSYSNANLLLRERVSLNLLSTMNKLIYCIYCIENYCPELFDDMLFRSKFAMMCSEVENARVMRKHNDLAEFATGGGKTAMSERHARAVDICNSISQYIIQENNNGKI